MRSYWLFTYWTFSIKSHFWDFYNIVFDQSKVNIYDYSQSMGTYNIFQTTRNVIFRSSNSAWIQVDLGLRGSLRFRRMVSLFSASSPWELRCFFKDAKMVLSPNWKWCFLWCDNDTKNWMANSDNDVTMMNCLDHLRSIWHSLSRRVNKRWNMANDCKQKTELNIMATNPVILCKW